MICGFCHRELPADLEIDPKRPTCGSCFGGCRKIHCPWCGYGNPVPGKLLKRLLSSTKKRG